MTITKNISPNTSKLRVTKQLFMGFHILQIVKKEKTFFRCL